MLAAAEQTERHRSGEGHCRVAQSHGQSRIVELRANSPLRLLTPKNHGPFVWLFPSTLGGGVVHGDRIRLRLQVDPHANALLSGQGWTRIYGGPSQSELSLDARVAPEGTLVVWPEPTVCFGGARLRQQTLLDVDEGGSLLFVDVLGAGRAARGERWAFEELQTRLRLQVAGRLLADETWRLVGDGPRRLGPYDAFATVLLVGPRFLPFASDVLRAPPAPLPESSLWLSPQALLLRLAAPSIHACTAELRRRLAFVPSLLEDDPSKRRS